MRSRLPAPLPALVLALALALGGCGGSGSDDGAKAAAGPDRKDFVPITSAGIAAVVDAHLGDRVTGYYVFADAEDEATDPQQPQRTLGITLGDGNKRDSFLLTVFPEGGSDGEVVPGACPDAQEEPDPLATVTCTPAVGGGNVTLTHYDTGFDEDNTKGSYLDGSGTGPKAREATVSYESFAKEFPISDKDLAAVLGDPYLGWETAARFNKAGESLELTKVD